MTDTELRELARKVVDGSASKEEVLVFTQAFNAILAELKNELAK